eukprot:5989670-Amphidinium_carterae.1
MARGSSARLPCKMTEPASAIACGPTSCNTTPTFTNAKAGQSFRPSPMKPTSTGPQPCKGISRSLLPCELCPRPCPHEAALTAEALSSGRQLACMSTMPTASATVFAAVVESP